MKRKMYAQELLYPESCEGCEAMFADFNAKLDHSLGENTLPNFTPRAVIVPHAGFLYSGFTANFTYRLLQEKSADKKRLIVIAKSEKARFEGISGSFYKKYKTPCGKLKIDIEYLDMLRTSCGVGFVEDAHKESATEVQMPFIKHYLSDLKVVELLYDVVEEDSLENLLELCLADEENVVIVCTDLGDLQEQKELGIIDATYLNAISMLESDRLHEGCNASGLVVLKALIESAKKIALKPQILNYQTSSINTGERVSIEGHLSVALY
jgi:AmmeMemoRadiSam system protein B